MIQEIGCKQDSLEVQTLGGLTTTREIDKSLIKVMMGA